MGRLRRVCAPRWGSFEWGGAFSDNSPEMRDAEVRSELEVDEEEGGEDGTFWMAFDDFLQRFSSVDVCFAHVPALPPAAQPSLWPDSLLLPEPRAHPPLTAGSVVRRKLHFSPCSLSLPPSGEPSLLLPSHWLLLNICPRHISAADERVECLIGLHQRDERTPSSPRYLDFGLFLLHDVQGQLLPVLAPAGPSGVERLASVSCSVRRDVLLRASLLPGEYVLVPTSSGREPCEANGKGSGVSLLDESNELIPAARFALEQVPALARLSYTLLLFPSPLPPSLHRKLSVLSVSSSPTLLPYQR